MSEGLVTAVIVTRGDVNVSSLVKEIPWPTVVWDNSKEENLSVYGRYAALAEVRTPLAYLQDDDVCFERFGELLEEYTELVHDAASPARESWYVGNMDWPWVDAGRYEDMVLVGAGSIVPTNLPARAFESYLNVFPADQLFLDQCDFIFGTLARGHRVDLGYTALEHATAANRLCNQEFQEQRKWQAIGRAEAVKLSRAHARA